MITQLPVYTDIKIVNPFITAAADLSLIVSYIITIIFHMTFP